METIKAKQLIEKLSLFQQLAIVASPKEWLVFKDGKIPEFHFTNDPHRYTLNNSEIYQIDELKAQIR